MVIVLEMLFMKEFYVLHVQIYNMAMLFSSL